MNASQFAKPGQLKLPGRGGSSAPAAPLMPTQGVFRQKPWLPWWLIPLLLLLLLLLFLFLRSQPQNVLVPKVVGEKSTFDAEKKLTDGRPQARPEQEGAGRRQGAGRARSCEQTPKAGEKVEKGTPVAVLVAVGTGKHNVPTSPRRPPPTPTSCCATKELTLGQASPQPVDPKGLIVSPDPGRGRGRQGRHAGQHLLRRPGRRREQEEERQEGRQEGRRAAGGGGGGGGGGGDEAAADIIIPAIGKDDLDAYAKKVADLGIVPKVPQGVQRRAQGHAVRDRPARRHEGRAEVQGDAARLRRPAAGRLHQRQEHPARSTGPTAPSSTRSRPARTTRRTRPGPPTASTSPTSPTGG